MDSEVMADLKAMGADDAQIAAAAKRGRRLAVWGENLAAVQLFAAVQTQWRRVQGFGAAIVQGLDYPAVKAAHEMRGGEWSARLFADIQTMEAAALGVLNRT